MAAGGPDLTAPYTQIARQFGAAGYPITGPGRYPAAQHVTAATMKVRYSGAGTVVVGWSGAAQSSSTESLTFTMVSATARRVWTLTDQVVALRPYVGAGVGYAAFTSHVAYGESDRISPIEPSGAYTYLNRLDLSGAAWGSVIELGVELAGMEFVEGGLDVDGWTRGFLAPAIRGSFQNGAEVSQPMTFLQIGASVTWSFRGWGMP